MVRPFQNADTKKSMWQVLNTFAPFFVLWLAMYYSLRVGYWLTLLLALPTAGLMVRMFIIQHDCGHGSFFKSRQLNDSLGNVCSLFTLTPFYQWRKSHAVHHATSGNLARRDVHDVYTMTVKEYNASPLKTRLRYRLYRNPITLFLILPLTLFLVLYRFPGPLSRRKERINVLLNDLALVLLVMPADHVILDTEAWCNAVRHGAQLAAQGMVVTFGITIIIQNGLLTGFSADSLRLPAGNIETQSVQLAGMHLGVLPIFTFVVAFALIRPDHAGNSAPIGQSDAIKVFKTFLAVDQRRPAESIVAPLGGTSGCNRGHQYCRRCSDSRSLHLRSLPRSTRHIRTERCYVIPGETEIPSP